MMQREDMIRKLKEASDELDRLREQREDEYSEDWRLSQLSTACTQAAEVLEFFR